MTYVVALTGGIGSGKTTVANLFAEKGVTVIDTDQLARDVIQPGQRTLNQIIKKFGSSILLADGTLNRSLLRHKVFANDRDRLWLEALLHPLIRKEMQIQAELAKSPYCIVVIPLLFEGLPNPIINRILVVDAPESLQISRAMARDNSSAEAITNIMQTQVSREKRLAEADDIIVNEGDLSEIKAEVDKLHELYLKKSA